MRKIEKHECEYLAILDALIADLLLSKGLSFRDINNFVLAAKKTRDDIYEN